MKLPVPVVCSGAQAEAQSSLQQGGPRLDELLLLVNERNGGARALYAQRGYTVEGEPLDGEECDIQALWFFGGGQRVTWRTCKNVCMRRQGLSGLT